MKHAEGSSELESLARDTKRPLPEVTALFERERDALALGAKITNFVTLLAVRRVRDQMRTPARSH